MGLPRIVYASADANRRPTRDVPRGFRAGEANKLHLVLAYNMERSEDSGYSVDTRYSARHG